MDTATMRAWWAHRQGLDGSLAGATPAEVLERSGWARSVGGAGPYLTLHARAGSSRKTADDAVAAFEIHELPAARGCTYVVPTSDFAFALRAAQTFAQAPLKVAFKLGVTEDEVERLCETVLRVIGKQRLDPEEIGAGAGDAVRNLGAAGKAKGLSTTLPLALGLLQSRGEIRRVPVDGRMDQQRYRYAIWKPNPLRGLKLTEEQAAVELARRYFAWAGPATRTEFQWFSGLSARAAKEAIDSLSLADAGDGRLLPPDLEASFKKFKPPREPHYTLVSSLDAIGLLRRDRLLDPSDETPAGPGPDFPHHAILDRGRVIGYWEYDTAAQMIVWRTFVKPNKPLEAAIRCTEDFVRRSLGDARSSALDSPASRTPRIAALRAGA